MVEPAGNISSVVGVVLQVGKWLAAPIGRQFMYLYNYNTNFKNLEKEVDKLKVTRDEVQVKVTAAEINVEEIKQSVKDWQTKVNNTITEADGLIGEKEENPRCFKGLRPNCITGFKLSKKAFKLKRDDIDKLLLQEEKFDRVSYPTIPPDKNFDKLRDDVLKLKNARLKVQRKVVEAKNNEEEVEEDVKKWLEDVDSIIVKAEDLIQNQSSSGTDRKIGYQKSKAASELMVDVIGPLLRQEERFDKVSYSTIQLSNYEKNFDKLRNDVLKLKNSRFKVQHKIAEAKNNVEEIEEDVKKWLEDVDSIIVKAEDLIQNQSSIGTDCKARYQNSNAASELMVDKIGPLLKQEERFNKVSHPTIHKEIWLRSSEDYLAFESRNSTVKNVWDALNDKNIYLIGVYGMGGIGKTTLVQEIGREVEKDKLFEEIVFVELTETPDVKKIQTEIADKLGVKFNNQSERANKLYERLRNGKKILLILDNVWEDLDLKTIGIPSKTNRGGCKIMLTTRNLDVLQKMESTSNFGMGILEEEESWNLFMKMTGNVIQACELNSLPKDVCKECGGLPIVICTIAKALRNKSRPSAWKVALQELKAPSPTKFIGLLEKEYVKIALSYKYLRNDELKKTFLISSLMKNNTSISNLFRHVVSLDILEGANLKMEDARDRLDTLVCELKDSCLLLDGFTTRQLAMHDVIRAVAITIAYTDHHAFTERNDVEKEWKDKDKLKKCTKISLPPSSTIISQLWPEYLDCPNLEYFCMTNMWNASLQIPKEFFTVMPKLKVLNLFETQQSSLPLSLGFLTNLRTLCLDQSRIEDVVIIGELKKLEVLSLRHSYIKKLPPEIGQLTQLKILDLRYCWQLTNIAPNVISKLLQLEELYIKGCRIHWKIELVEEFKHLTQMTTLTLVIKDDIVLPQCFFSRDLKSYEISIGDWQLDPKEREFTRVLKSKFNSTISSEDLRRVKNVEFLWLTESLDFENGLYNSEMGPLFKEQVIFADLKVLTLTNINYGKIWDSQLPTSSCPNLTKLTLMRCGNIKYLFPSTMAKSLQQLQELNIEDCQVLKEIVAKEEEANNQLPTTFGQNLTKLTLMRCGNIKYVFPSSIAKNLQQLQELKITDCKVLEEIVAQEDGANIQLPTSFCQNLTKLTLMRCGNIKYVFPSSIAKNLQQLQELKITDCKILEEIVAKEDGANNQFPTSLCQNLTKLTLMRCGNIKYVFPSFMAKSLKQLQELEIEDCQVLEEIVAKEEGANSIVNIVFPNVTSLKLVRLPQLTTFYPGMHTLELPILKELEVIYCDEFASRYLSFQENDKEGETHISELKSLFFDNKITMIWRC